MLVATAVNMSSRHSKAQVERAISRAALGLFFLVLLLAPAAGAKGEIRGRHLRQRPSSARRRQAPSVCNRHVTGCSACTTELPKVAAGAEFPGGGKPPPLEHIVRCSRCNTTSYEFNRELQNCDCKAGFGTAFANGTLIQVDFFVAPKLPTSASDSMPFPDETNASSKAATKPAGGTTTMTFAEASSTPSQGIAGLETTQTRDAQKQRNIRRQFESSMQSLGYSVRSTDKGTFVSANPKAVTFASSNGQPTGVETVTEQPLICVACKDNMVSIGGLIGGSYCMPCEAGMKPDPTRSTCVPASTP